MVHKIIANLDDPPIGALIVLEFLRSKLKDDFEVKWDKLSGKNPPKVQLFGPDNSQLGETNNDVARYLARLKNYELYGGKDALARTQVDHWLTYAEMPYNKVNTAEESFNYLNNSLAPRTWFVAKQMTIADICLFAKIYNHQNVNDSFLQTYPNLARWYKQILSFPEVQKVLKEAPKVTKKADSSKTNKTSKEQAKFVDLPGAEMGKVIVRFPPEASGYLHIGHAKAALLNQHYALHFQGQLIMRFDDTNPAKENVVFEKAILEDLEMLEIKPDRFTHSSDYFDLMLEYCEKLLKDGKAFVDDTPAAKMKELRDQKLPSENRNNSVEKNLSLWREMVKGSSKGQECCVRAKIDYQSPNGCMRDPTIYRCKPEPHPRTGTKYKVYPTYDFACPIVDAVENVTHTLRTTEYHDRDEQFYWFIKNLNLNSPHIYEYSRLNMTNTVLSKRKLTWFVDEGLVDGWEDPRMPTVRGILRRGMTVEGLKQFIIAQGSSRSVVFMEWDKIWAFNKKVIDPVATRYTALTAGDTVPVNVKGVKYDVLKVANHPKDPSLGTKEVRIGPTILIEEEDAEGLKEGHNATFINWGNLMIEKIYKENGKVIRVDASPNLENKDFKNTLKLTWIVQDKPEETYTAPEKTSTPCYTVYFDHIITKPVLAKDDDFKDYVAKNTRIEIEMIGEAALKRVKAGEIIQLQRKGFFKCDVPYGKISPLSNREQPLILFHIPDGHSTITLPGASDKTTLKMAKEQNTQSRESASKLHSDVTAQGNKLRQLKAAKADKATIDAEIKKLLELKNKYESLTGQEYYINTPPPADTAPTHSTPAGESAIKLHAEVTAQGNKLRELKAAKADKAAIDKEVKQLLELKTKYKALTGQEYNANNPPPAEATATTKAQSAESASQLHAEVTAQGNKLRELKSSKADKGTIDVEVKKLLELKNKFKLLTGQEYNANSPPPAKSESNQQTQSHKSASQLHAEVTSQGNKLRELKTAKADKTAIDAEVKKLLELKANYKSLTGQEYNANTPPPAEVTSTANVQFGEAAIQLHAEVTAQGNKLRELKSAKADKATIDAEVKKLLELKNKYKQLTGQEYNANTPPTAENSSTKSSSCEESASKLFSEVTEQGNKVRELKAAKADKKTIDNEVKTLLSLKNKYKSVTGQDYNANMPPPVVRAPEKTNSDSDESACDLFQNIVAQERRIKELKTANADISTMEPEVRNLMVLKLKYKFLTGREYKINSPPMVKTETNKTALSDEALSDLHTKIMGCEEKVKMLKASKANTAIIDEENKQLLELKSKYKAATGHEYDPKKPPTNKSEPTDNTQSGPSASKLHAEVKEQGDKLRDLKSAKADKATIDAEVKKLLELKNKFKTLTGQEYDANKPPPAETTPTSESPDSANQLHAEVTAQGNKLRELKSSKADKATIDVEVKKLLELKSKYKSLTGQEYNANTPPSNTASKDSTDDTKYSVTDPSIMKLAIEIRDQEAIVRELPQKKPGSEIVTKEVAKLSNLKADFKKQTGSEWTPAILSQYPQQSNTKEGNKENNKNAKVSKNAKSSKIPKKPDTKAVTKDDSNKTGTRLGLEAKKNENLPDWYSQVITKGEMIEYYDVSGCYILRPWSYAIWDILREFFDREIKKLGVQNCYFPIFVSKTVLEREKTHIADFAPEVAWVTKSGESDLAEHIAIRPTSETVMYPAYAKWLKSHRDLPLKLNQWNNVVRWEFKHPQPFLRTREFLWQEGHTAFATKAEADEEVLTILDLYARIYEEYLAIPVVKGRKTEKEKFAGGDYTTTVEAYISASGRAIQGGTSHHLGQNFSKMFDIQIETAQEGSEKTYVYQNSWGITTRTIGVMIMVHGDDKGLVLPPKVACLQAVIVPCGITASTTQEQRNKLLKECELLENELKKDEIIRVKGDYRDNYSPGWKFNHWELKGVPVRVELGPKDLEKGQVTFVRRDTAERLTANRTEAYSTLLKLLDEIQSNLFNKAKAELNQHIKQTHNWNEFCTYLDDKNLILAPFCGRVQCEDKIKADSAREEAEEGAPSMGAKGLCIPFDQPDGSSENLNKLKCIHTSCQEKPKFYTLFGRSY